MVARGGVLRACGGAARGVRSWCMRVGAIHPNTWVNSITKGTGVMQTCAEPSVTKGVGGDKINDFCVTLCLNDPLPRATTFRGSTLT